MGALVEINKYNQTRVATRMGKDGCKLRFGLVIVAQMGLAMECSTLS